MKRATHTQLTGQVFDLVVIGGGITGAATARDAVLRGLSVVLIEKDDFAAGTSSRSAKLIHGGLRYLETYQFKLVAESLRERERALTIAPHLTEVRPFLYLLYDGYPESKALLNLGLTFYDLASGSFRARRHQMLNSRQVQRREPHLNTSGLRGAGLYYDVLTDDARLTMDVAKGAWESGALIINHAEVTALVLVNGVARGVTVHDSQTDENFEIAARQIVNATGPWTDRTRSLEHTTSQHKLRPTKGVHIVLRKTDFPLNTAVFLRSPDDNRVVWPTPSLQEDVVYIGSTDTDYDGDLDDVHPDERDIEYLVNVANATIPDSRITPDHIVGSWAGLRPLVAPSPGVSATNTSREHQITEGATGMLTITGGKLTSNRLMAKQLVDAVTHALSRRAPRSSAGHVPLSGADMDAARAVALDAQHAGVPDDLAAGWVSRYGSNASFIFALWKKSERNRAVIGARGLTRAEIRYAVDEEMVGSLEDLLVRRTSQFFWDFEGGLGLVEAVADELTAQLGWDVHKRQAEIDHYRVLVQKHRPRKLGTPT